MIIGHQRFPWLAGGMGHGPQMRIFALVPFKSSSETSSWGWAKLRAHSADRSYSTSKNHESEIWRQSAENIQFSKMLRQFRLTVMHFIISTMVFIAKCLLGK